MIRFLLKLAAAGAVVGGTVFWILTIPNTLDASDLPDHNADLANGEYMFNIGGCASCHAAPKSTGDARQVLVGGVTLGSPFGDFHVPNISQDKETGIGGWSDIDFINAMVKGVSPEGQHYFPAFPYRSYQNMTIPDLLDLKAFLDTTPAKSSQVPDHELPFPFNIRRSVGMWKLMYLDGKPADPAPDASDSIKRGAYLVRGPAHCGECHTPRDILGGPIDARSFGGAPNPEGKGFIPNITPHKTGIKSWSEDELVTSFEDGFKPDFDSFGSSMVEVQINLSLINDGDRRAIAQYLLSLDPVDAQRPPKK